VTSSIIGTLASVVASVSTEIWATQATALIQQSLLSSGSSQADATKNSAIIIAMLNVALVILTMGASAGRLASVGAKAVGEVAADVATTASEEASTFESVTNKIVAGVKSINFSKLVPNPFSALI
jgi:hypothetical protein